MPVQRPSVCPLDCPDTCSLDVTVEAGRITAVRGSHANPYTGGVICGKVGRYPQLVHGRDRLQTPLVRTGRKGAGRFEPVSWEQALDTIHERFSAIIATHGAQAIAPLNYAGPHGLLAMGSMDQRFFHRLGASRLHRTAMCGGVRGEAYAATFGAVPGMPPEQIADARTIVLWGVNATVTHLHLVPPIHQARRNGARLVVVDPVRSGIARKADLHIPLLPGTDTVLAWAVATELERLGGLDHDFIASHVLGAQAFMERARTWPPERAAAECGVPAESIRTLARWFHEGSPAAICCGNGPERTRSGGSGLRSVFALPALAGKFGVPGGGVCNGASTGFPKTLERLQRPDLLASPTRVLNIIDIGAHLLDESLAPPLQGLFIYNHNPLAVHPHQNRLRRGLSREDLFTVVSEVVPTDTVRYADVVLPAATHFEHADVYAAYGQHYLQRAEAVIEPPGEAVPNTELFRRLARRFGFDEPCFADDDAALMDAALDADDPRMQGHTGSTLPLRQALPMRYDGAEAVLFRNVFPATPSGRIELESAHLAEQRGSRLPHYEPAPANYPLALVTPASIDRTTSTFGGLSRSDHAWLEMHPDDAAARGLRDGMHVRAWNDLGEVHLPLRVRSAVRPGVVCSHKGAWERTSANGQTVAALMPTHHADLAEGGCFNDARVEVAALQHGNA